MKYRAKVTAIQAWVENHYNTNKYNLVKDAYDTYIEVDNEDEAEKLETLNKLRREERKLKMEITDTYERW